MKTILNTILTVSLLGLASCSSMQTASVADYNGDGLISDAEHKQYSKQQNVQRENVYTESTKRRNAVNTVGDVNETLWNIKSARNLLRNW